MKIPCTRPNDFYAEMMRSAPLATLDLQFASRHLRAQANLPQRPDKQMYRVRQQAAEEERRIKADSSDQCIWMSFFLRGGTCPADS